MDREVPRNCVFRQLIMNYQEETIKENSKPRANSCYLDCANGRWTV